MNDNEVAGNCQEKPGPSDKKKTPKRSFIQRRASKLSAFVSNVVTTSIEATSAAANTVFTGIESAVPVVRLRPSWNTSFGLAIKTLRIAAYTVRHDINTIRLLTDHGIPSVVLPGKVSYHRTKIPNGEWTYLTSTNFQKNRDLSAPVPIILYFHGGAFCCCGSNTHRGLLFRLVRATKAIVFAVDYRRPPEHPFPAPILDCIEAYKYLLSNFVDPGRIIFAGDSAGGSLVASVSMKVHELGLPSPAGGVMLSPWVDLSDAGTTDSWYRNESYDYLPQHLAAFMAAQYVGSLRNDALASPMYSQTLHALPPLHVEVGECEVLHDQIVNFCTMVQAAGVNVDVRVREDMVHVFCLFSFSGLSQCKEAFRSIAQFIRSRTAVALGLQAADLLAVDGINECDEDDDGEAIIVNEETGDAAEATTDMGKTSLNESLRDLDLNSSGSIATEMITDVAAATVAALPANANVNSNA